MDAFTEKVNAKIDALEAEDEHLHNMERGLQQKRAAIAGELANYRTALDVYRSLAGDGQANPSSDHVEVELELPVQRNGRKTVEAAFGLDLPPLSAPLVRHCAAVIRAYGGRVEAGVIRDHLWQPDRKLGDRTKAIAYAMVRSTLARHTETFRQRGSEWELVEAIQAPLRATARSVEPFAPPPQSLEEAAERATGGLHRLGPRSEGRYASH